MTFPLRVFPPSVFSPRALSISLLLASCLAWSQVPLDKERAAGIVQQVLTERGIALQSADDSGSRYKSQPFKFDSESQVHYQGSYSFQLVNGEIKVTVTDIKFASGLPTLFPVSGAVLANLTGPLQQRVQELAAGAPAVATMNASAQPATAAGKTAAASAGPAFNANGEPMNPTPGGLIPGRPPGQSAPAVIPASGDQLNQADILGINLDMSAAQAAKVLAGKAKWTERQLKTGIGSDYKQQNFSVGTLQYRCAGAGPCKLANAVEAVTTYALPGQPDLVGIHRVRIYGDKEKPLLNETIKALQDKYGREIFHTPFEKLGYAQSYSMRWLTNMPGGVRGDYNGLGPVDQKSAAGCPIAYLPEAPIPAWGNPKLFFSTGDIDANLPITNEGSFFTDMNRVLRKEGPQTGCGTLMGAVLTLDANRDYVSRIEIGVLNYARLDAQMLAVGSAFVKESEALRTQKVGKDKARKPEL